MTKQTKKGYWLNAVIALDQLFNALLGGWADETLSARSYREGLWCEKWINQLFFRHQDTAGHKNHCEQCYWYERRRQDLPKEYRMNENIEQMLWNTMKQATGSQTGIYRRKRAEGDGSNTGGLALTVNAVPEVPKPDGFAFEECVMYKTVRVFRIGVSDLDGLIPQAGDFFDYGGVTYEIRATQAGPCYENVGNHNVILRIAAHKYR